MQVDFSLVSYSQFNIQNTILQKVQNTSNVSVSYEPGELFTFTIIQTKNKKKGNGVLLFYEISCKIDDFY